MIRRNLIVSEEDLINKFLPRRELDQPGYRVGKINNEVVVINLDNVVMDNFYDDRLDIEWFDLELVDKLYKGYKINRNGEVIGIKNNSKLTKLYDIWGYPIYKIKGKHLKVHRLLSQLFKPNYDFNINNEVDHIDRNKDNYNLSNLRWVSRAENVNNKNFPSYIGNKLYVAYIDKDLKIESFRLSSEDIYTKYNDTNKNYKYRILESIRLKCRFDNYYWKIYDLDLINYLQGRTVDESLWKEHYLGGFFVHPIGLIKNKRGIVTPGTSSLEKNYQDKRYSLNINGIKHSKRVHILVAEVFLNNNQPIPKGLVVDHIDTNPSNNCLGNLRITSQKGNMNNPLTVKKLSKRIVDKDGRIFESISACAKFYKVSVQAIWARLNGRRPCNGFRYLSKSETENNKEN